MPKSQSSWLINQPKVPFPTFQRNIQKAIYFNPSSNQRSQQLMKSQSTTFYKQMESNNHLLLLLLQSRRLPHLLHHLCRKSQRLVLAKEATWCCLQIFKMKNSIMKSNEDVILRSISQMMIFMRKKPQNLTIIDIMYSYQEMKMLVTTRSGCQARHRNSRWRTKEQVHKLRGSCRTSRNRRVEILQIIHRWRQGNSMMARARSVTRLRFRGTRWVLQAIINQTITPNANGLQSDRSPSSHHLTVSCSTMLTKVQMSPWAHLHIQLPMIEPLSYHLMPIGKAKSEPITPN